MYEENGTALSIGWEISVSGASIYIPTEDEWNAFCIQHEADWAREQKDMILQRAAEGLKKDKYLKGRIQIAGSWIQIYSD